VFNDSRHRQHDAVGRGDSGGCDHRVTGVPDVYTLPGGEAPGPLQRVDTFANWITTVPCNPVLSGSPAQTIMAASADGSIRLWKSNEAFEEVQAFQGHNQNGQAMPVTL
jgi:WD40 repeat protein